MSKHLIELSAEVDGAVTLAGITWSDDLPVARATRSYGRGRGDAFVARFDPEGQVLQMATWIGGPARDEAFAVALDGRGRAIVVGRVGGDLPDVAPIGSGIASATPPTPC